MGTALGGAFVVCLGHWTPTRERLPPPVWANPPYHISRDVFFGSFPLPYTVYANPQIDRSYFFLCLCARCGLTRWPATRQRHGVGLSVAECRTSQHGRPHHRRAGHSLAVAHLLRGDRWRRALQNHQRRHHLPRRLGYRARLLRRHDRHRAQRHERRVLRHRRAELPQLDVARRWTLEEHRRRQVVEVYGAQRNTAHRPHRGASQRSEHRICRRLGRRVDHQCRPWPLQNHRRWRLLDEDQIHQHQRRRCGRGARSAQSGRGVGSELRTPPRPLLPHLRRSGIGALEKHRCRQDLHRSEGERLPGNDQGSHRNRYRVVESRCDVLDGRS